jgi:succinate-semialdehyde dehydrogenase / glutarate-semialdehyde dehydrogenase
MSTTTTRTFPIVNPATGEAVAHVPDSGPEEARAAATLAARAFPAWRDRTAYDRSAVLKKWHALMLENETVLAELMTKEMGKPITESRGEVKYAAAFVEWYAEEAKRIYGETVPSQFAHKRLLVRPQPVGPVYAVTPWNFPAAMITRKAAPALAAGCTFIVKPAEQSPLTAIELANLWVKAGGPPEVFQVITTSEPAAVSAVFFDDPAIRKLTFTGSTEIGILLAAQATRTVKRVSLELGGHAPFLVFDDADLDAAVKEVIASKFRNTGQTCVCANRIYVQDGIHDEFANRFARAVEGLRVGDPMDPQTQVGPLVNGDGLQKVAAHVRDAVAKGARAVIGGEARSGLFFSPTVLTGVAAGMRILEEETFGPVAPIVRFKTDADAVEQANNTPFGLAAYLWTRDLSRAFRVAEALDYGIVGVNDGVPSTPQAPFGGVKASGLGREGGKWGIEEYLDLKYISIALA